MLLFCYKISQPSKLWTYWVTANPLLVEINISRYNFVGNIYLWHSFYSIPVTHFVSYNTVRKTLLLLVAFRSQYCWVSNIDCVSDCCNTQQLSQWHHLVPSIPQHIVLLNASIVCWYFDHLTVVCDLSSLTNQLVWKTPDEMHLIE